MFTAWGLGGFGILAFGDGLSYGHHHRGFGMSVRGSCGLGYYTPWFECNLTAVCRLLCMCDRIL